MLVLDHRFRPPSEEDQSPPPSDDGELSDDKAYINGKAKGKAKGKKTGQFHHRLRVFHWLNACRRG